MDFWVDHKVRLAYRTMFPIVSEKYKEEGLKNYVKVARKECKKIIKGIVGGKKDFTYSEYIKSLKGVVNYFVLGKYYDCWTNVLILDLEGVEDYESYIDSILIDEHVSHKFPKHGHKPTFPEWDCSGLEFCDETEIKINERAKRAFIVVRWNRDV